MGMHHHHHHGQSHRHNHKHDDKPNNAIKNLAIAFFLNLAFTLIEVVGGFYTGSIAILSDALHDLGDSFALGMALFIEILAGKQATAKFSYGFRRLSLLSAGMTSVILVVGVVIVYSQAIPRLFEPAQPKTTGMIILAVFGILVNGLAAARTWGGKTMNERTISWHMIEDVLGWVAILIGAVVMKFWDLPILDPILSMVFSLFILFGVMRNLSRVVKLFLQAVPDSIAVKEMCDKILAQTSVKHLHDVHLWSLDGDSHVMTMHAVLPDMTSVEAEAGVKANIRNVLRGYGNIHLTLELERENEQCAETHCGSSIF